MLTDGPTGERLDPGWQAESDAWILSELARLGISPTGPVENVRVRAWSIVRRVGTSTGRVWFKTNVPTNGFEAAVVGALAEWAPEHVLAPLAVDRAKGWLLSPDGGPTLREVTTDLPDPARWADLLRTYAQLQRLTVPYADQLVELGLPDLRPERMSTMLAELLADKTVTLDPDRRAALEALSTRYDSWCAELAADGLPAALQHDDLHDGNVFVSGDGGPAARLRFFDWGDACLAHPFTSLLVALNVAAYRFGFTPGGPELARLRDAYLEPWTDLRDRADLIRSVRLALRVGKVGRALTWQRALRGAAAPEWERALGGPAPVSPEHADAVGGWLGELTEPDLA